MMRKAKKVEKAKEPVVLAEEPAPATLTPEEMWAKAIEERKTIPPWSCTNPVSPVYEYIPAIWLNEEEAWRDDNVFEVNEPLSVYVGIKSNMVSKYAKYQPVTGVKVRILKPDNTTMDMVTDIDGKARFSPNIGGKWTFFVDDMGIAPWFNVTK